MKNILLLIFFGVMGMVCIHGLIFYPSMFFKLGGLNVIYGLLFIPITLHLFLIAVTGLIDVLRSIHSEKS